MSMLRYITPMTYWLLILLWAFIFVFYLQRILSGKVKSRLTIVLMIILTIEAFRTLFESIYFGAWYTSLSGLLPEYIHSFLIQPEMVLIPKSLNVIAAVFIIFILIRKWMPHEGNEIEMLDKIVESRTYELRDVNTKLLNEIEKRKDKEQELKELNESLEERIHVRTSELEESNKDLHEAISKIKTLSGLIPICANCKKIRDDTGYWKQIEEYIEQHSNADFSHDICPDCAEKLYGEEEWYKKKNK